MPFYWKKGRVDSGNDKEPFFGCLDCLDEFQEEYSIACSVWCVAMEIELGPVTNLARFC